MESKDREPWASVESYFRRCCCVGEGKIDLSGEVRDLKRNVWDFTEGTVKCAEGAGESQG